jgi:hypothetical protein
MPRTPYAKMPGSILKRTGRTISTIAASPHILPSLPLLLPFPHPVLPLLREMAIPEHRPRTRLSLPSVLMRAGTSKGLFIHRRDLPSDPQKWGDVLLAAMGSRDGDYKQIDGVGGATSTTSKVAVVEKSSRPDADVDYTFAQVAVGQGKVDFSGNCGNMASGVGPFALDEGLVQAKPGQTEVCATLLSWHKLILISRN